MDSAPPDRAPGRALDYCRDRVAPPGSAMHYALLRFEGEPLHRALATHAVVRELCDTVEGSGDAAVSHRKLAWWLEEIERAGAGRATHPATLTLQRTAAKPAALAPAAMAAERVLRARGCESFDELERYGAQTAGLALALSLGEEADGDVARMLGAGLTLARALGELRRRDGQAAALLPRSSLSRHGVEDAMLYAPRAGPALVAHTREHAGRARDACARAGECTGYARALRAIALAGLRKLERNGYDPLGRDMRTAPLRKLWIAWRNA